MLFPKLYVQVVLTIVALDFAVLQEDVLLAIVM